MAITTSPILVRKAVARVALVGVDPPTATLVRDSFRQLGVETVELGENATQRLNREKFEGCVLLLDDNATAILEAARNSPSNRRMVIYGVTPAAQQALRFSQYGINAVIDLPAERQTVSRAVRSTYLLLIHELRRYVRVPVVTEVSLALGTTRLKTTSVEISAGGMSLRTPTRLPLAEPLEVSFTLPNHCRIRVRAITCWMRAEEGMAGIRFDSADPRRSGIKEWIDQYLELA